VARPADGKGMKDEFRPVGNHGRCRIVQNIIRPGCRDRVADSLA
jgi:hypothetical protein